MLQVQQIVKYFGGVHAVDGVSFDVAAGECVALIGPNGAGKSTCFACIAGQYPLTGGHILWNGKALEQLAPAARLQHGVARTFQVAQVFEALTVLQNVQLTIQASIAHQAISAFKQLEGQSREAASALLQEVHQLARHYGWSEAQILALPAHRRAHYLALVESTS